jgi:hypothetical protein
MVPRSLSLASECSRGALHLNSDWAILECVDQHGRAASPGEAGTTALLTTLWSFLAGQGGPGARVRCHCNEPGRRGAQWQDAARCGIGVVRLARMEDLNWGDTEAA